MLEDGLGLLFRRHLSPQFWPDERRPLDPFIFSGNAVVELVELSVADGVCFNHVAFPEMDRRVHVLDNAGCNDRLYRPG